MTTEAPRMIAGVRLPARDREFADTWFSRLWLAIPERLGQICGALVMFSWLAFELPIYLNNFWTMGAWYVFSDGSRINIPWTRVLVDANILLIGLAFVCRRPAKLRAQQASTVLLSLLAGWWPILPFLMISGVALVSPETARTWAVYVQSSQLNLLQVLSGAALIMLGNVIDLSGYVTLFRSFSIVPEARKLKTSGLYRFVRHPVYLGQFIAQAGVWLIFAPPFWCWWAFYATFVALQLWRTKREDAILERAFGQEYRSWKERTFWFV